MADCQVDNQSINQSIKSIKCVCQWYACGMYLHIAIVHRYICNLINSYTCNGMPPVHDHVTDAYIYIYKYHVP